ncbi:hypothetical protein BTM25_56900 [Actinomadura rubteroloni]|uniref:Na+/H+ antiporter subunit E n=1 Tax=Actinomadura rubteroloni TaxID=1926885 RepID=A0A2P4UB55_9ACTN|nr:hypothetical protein [Actinomadura rubteroloni]POM22278.1 hypothetical protein BTM25_56900 [Actinomadura rubteroloni]
MRGARRAVAVAATAALCFALYVALISEIVWPQLVVAGVAAVVASAAGYAAARLLTSGPERPEPARRGGAARAVAALPVQIVADARWLALPVPSGARAEFRGPAPAGPDWTGVVTLLLSAAPGTFVTQVDPERGVFVLHRLASGPDLVERGLGR